MKKLAISILIIGILMSVFAGCQDSENGDTEESSEQTETTAYIEPTTTEVTETVSYQFNHEELSCTKGDNQIYGEIYKPDTGREKIPTVILCHGFGGSARDLESYAQQLAEHGYAAYIFDFVGGGENSRSGGSMLEMSLMTEKADLEAVLSKIKSLPYVDTTHLYLFGGSQGAVVAAMTAAEHAEDVHGLVLLYPAFIIPESAKIAFPTKDTIPDTFPLLGIEVGRQYAEDIYDYSVFPDITRYKGDVLIIHGDKDSIAPISYSQHAVEEYKSAKLITIPDADHGFFGDDEKKSADYALSFLNEHQ